MRAEKPTALLPSPADIDEVRVQLQEWRQTRRHRSRIPEAIWTSATTLARAHGVAKISRALRLDYYALRRRLGPAPETPPSDSPRFVERVLSARVHDFV
jgi:hypothetical protein